METASLHEPIVSVTELTLAIKAALEPRFRSISVRGEISNFKLQSSGHLYFSLKDAGAQLSAVLFKMNASQLSRMPKDGDQVVASGELNIYAPRGNYQLIARNLQFLGMGELLLKFHELKERLRARGWFDSQRKKPLPKLPKRIGVVTSPTGAVIQDILNILTRRFQGFQVLLNPVKVQGDGAAQEIAQAISDFNRYQLADVLIVGRGGGSIEDLWAFNEEIVASAIYESKIPIISAVGHETDFTIADWVADVRAPTPSAAAEIAIAEKTSLLKFIQQTKAYLEQRLVQKIAERKQKLISVQRHPFLASPHMLLAPFIQQLDDLQTGIQTGLTRLFVQRKWMLDAASKQLALLEPTQRIAAWSEKLSSYPNLLLQAEQSLSMQRRERLQRLSQHLSSLHPQKLLQKGYAILFRDETNTIVSSCQELTSKQTIRAMLSDGMLAATVDTIDYDARILL